MAKRGLFFASKGTRERVARAGGKAEHPHGRGMQNVAEEKRKQIARLGGLARHRRDNVSMPM